MRRLTALLDREYDLAVNGDFEGLSRLLQEKEAAIAQMPQMVGITRDTAQQLASKADRNQRILRATADGIRDVTRRLAELRRLQDGFDSYSADGQRRNAPKSGRGHRY
ncbi:MAG: flagellar biosynthesis protein FlgN [Rhodobacteraceae bacterium]|nr:flagellar biosynthesis protein FlgN [Paracoccaceae bacterium]